MAQQFPPPPSMSRGFRPPVDPPWLIRFPPDGRRRIPQALYEPEGTHIEYKMVLPESMAAVLRSYSPGFRLRRQMDYDPRRVAVYDFSLWSTPAAVAGDFNGDAVLDAVVSGYDESFYRSLVILSTSSDSYRILEKSRMKRNSGSMENAEKLRHVLVFQPKGSVYDYGGDSATEREMRVLKNDGFANGNLWHSRDDGTEGILVDQVFSLNDDGESFSAWALLADYYGAYPAGPIGRVRAEAAPRLCDPRGPRTEYEIVLSSTVRRLIGELAPGFAMWRQGDYPPEYICSYDFSLRTAPSAVIGDFNGDSVNDVMLSGHDASEPIVVGIVSSGAGAYLVSRVSIDGEIGMRRQKSVDSIALSLLPRKLSETAVETTLPAYSRCDSVEYRVIGKQSDDKKGLVNGVLFWDEKKKRVIVGDSGGL